MAASQISDLTVRQLLARRRRLAAGLSEPERTLRGVLLGEGRRCSSEGCRCRRGELHGPYAYLAVYVDGRHVVVGHVGDSRTYHLHQGILTQLTRDQTLVARLVEILTRDTPTVPISFRVRHGDGSWRIFEAVGNNRVADPAIRGVILNARDVTEMKRAEEALRRANEAL